MVELGEVEVTAFCHDRTAVIHQLRLLLCFVCPHCADKHGETGVHVERHLQKKHT